MKLLYCNNCGDIIGLLIDQPRACDCGETVGLLTDQGVAFYSGENAIPVAIQNQSFKSALEMQVVASKAVMFDACFPPKNDGYFIKQKDKSFSTVAASTALVDTARTLSKEVSNAGIGSEDADWPYGDGHFSPYC